MMLDLQPQIDKPRRIPYALISRKEGMSSLTANKVSPAEEEMLWSESS